MKLKEMKITAFRGVAAGNLNLAGKNLILFGENGLGKSSIVEAIEFFFTGDLVFRKPMEIRKEHFVTVGYSSTQTKLEFIFENSETIERNISSFVDIDSKPSELRDFLEKSANAFDGAIKTFAITSQIFILTSERASGELSSGSI